MPMAQPGQGRFPSGNLSNQLQVLHMLCACGVSCAAEDVVEVFFV